MSYKHWLILAGVVILAAGCVNQPDSDIDLDGTIEAVVETKVSEANASHEDYLTAADLDLSQDQQNDDLHQYITDRLEAAGISGSDDSLTGSSVISPTATVVAKRITQTVNLSDDECTNQFTYVSDVTIPDGMYITPNTIFKKSWYITNSGTCTWDDKYQVVYNSGDEVGTAEGFQILDDGVYLKPGESIVVSAEIQAPSEVETAFSTYWGIKSGSGEVFGAGSLQNIYLSSNFYVSSEFNFGTNFYSAVCSDDAGYFTCGTSSSSDGRGFAYYDPSPTVESNFVGMPSIVISPPYTVGGKTRVEIGPIRVPKGTWFRMAFSCRPETPGCKSWVRLYVRETGFAEKLLEQTLEWNDGYVANWNVRLSDRGFYDQDLTYIFEVEAVGDGDKDDLIILQNPRLTEYEPVLDGKP